MQYWIVKFAPFRYSWYDCLKNNEFEIYSVRSYQACKNLKTMLLGDQVLFYHSQIDNKIMGLMEVYKEAHQDKTTNDIRWVSVTFKPAKSFEKPIPLSDIKNVYELKDIGLIKQPRLSVVKINYKEFNKIIELT